MTQDEIRALPPGAVLNEAVALALGWKYEAPDEPWLRQWLLPDETVVFESDLPDFSTNPATTGALLAEADRRGWAVTVKNMHGWTVWIEVKGVADSESAPTLSHAVALAFVLAGREK